MTILLQKTKIAELFLHLNQMKDYLTENRIPLTRIGRVHVPKLILGHLPFVGESYQGPERNQQYAHRFSDIRNIVKILRVAVQKFGVTAVAVGISADLSPPEKRLLEAMKETQHLTGITLGVIPCFQVPLKIKTAPIDFYRKWLTYYLVERHMTRNDLISKYVRDPILLSMKDWATEFQRTLTLGKPYREEEIHDVWIDYERLSKSIHALRNFDIILPEIGSETDFLTLTGRIDLLSTLITYIRDEIGENLLLGVHHAGSTIPQLIEHGISVDGYVSPINKLGAMMFPTKKKALEALNNCGKPVISIKPLAGGRITPRKALDYVYNEIAASSCMIGVGSEDETIEDLSTARDLLGAAN